MENNAMQVFENPEFGQIRTVEINGEPWFVGKDVAEILGYANQNRDIVRHVDEEDRLMMNGESKLNTEMVSSLGQRGGWVINESGLYSLILSSKLPTAKEFKRWVTSEVLPSIRKNGGYIYDQENMTDAELMAKAILVAQKTIESLNTRCKALDGQVVEQQKVIEEMKPKASYYDLILQSTNAVAITQIAQDYGMTAQQMNKKLNEMRVQRKVGKQWILYKEYSSGGYVDSETVPVDRRDGTIMSVMHTKWTQKGRLFIYDLLKKEGILPKMERNAV